ncbi:hypothetical protein COO60DRAFT_974263 [Scenedesmus sp. NREL 46B-D3]|nr:hypothetical protein COO60DRAFT_974263 [Scenedesmus sp. NREL 46B-D3]
MAATSPLRCITHVVPGPRCLCTQRNKGRHAGGDATPYPSASLPHALGERLVFAYKSPTAVQCCAAECVCMLPPDAQERCCTPIAGSLVQALHSLSRCSVVRFFVADHQHMDRSSGTSTCPVRGHVVIIIIIILPIQATASAPSAPCPTGTERGGSTAPECLHALRTSQDLTRKAAIHGDTIRHLPELPRNIIRYKTQYLG